MIIHWSIITFEVENFCVINWIQYRSDNNYAIFFFCFRMPLPEHWAGLRNEKLCEATLIDGSQFVHNNRFIGGNFTREGVLEMAKKALEIGHSSSQWCYCLHDLKIFIIHNILLINYILMEKCKYTILTRTCIERY